MADTIVSFRPYGRMGNFLFMAANTIAFAIRNNIEFSIPNHTVDQYWNPLYLQHLVNPKYEQGREDILINENGFEYKLVNFEDGWRGKQIVFNGYYQSEKYFKDYRNEILYLFSFPYEKKEGVVSCHVRRGDYIHLRDKHPEVTKEWYEEAMDKFDGYRFKFFSDDIAWCRSQFGGRRDCDFSSNFNEVEDLVEISCCEHNINSSSTFSWWGSWLNRNENKIIITPAKWFEDGWMGMNTKDLIPENWIKL